MADNGKRPNPRAVVEMLMKKNPDILRDVQTRIGGRVRKNVQHLVFACPLRDKCKSSGTLSFEKGTGFTNPFKHLVACVSDGDENHLYKMYEKALAEQRRARIMNHAELFPIVYTATEREKAMHAYITLITKLSLPVSSVINSVFRSHMKYKCEFGKNYFKEVLFTLTELVENKLREPWLVRTVRYCTMGGRTAVRTTSACTHLS